MEKTVRTFVAIKIKPEKKLIDVLSRLQQELAEEAIKWVEPNNLHITLKFLGDTEIKAVEQIKIQLDDIAEKNNPFKGELKGLDYFKNVGNPRVLFVNIYGAELLKEIAEKVEFQLHSLGFEKEIRNFKPHLTLARIKFLKNRRKFYQLVDNYIDFEFQEVQINEVIFYQSKLKPGGPEYLPLHIVKLSNK